VLSRGQAVTGDETDAQTFHDHQSDEGDAESRKNANLNRFGAQQRKHLLPDFTPPGITHCRLPRDPNIFIRPVAKVTGLSTESAK